MLEIRLNCENCDKYLPNNSEDAMICSFECTYCKECVDKVLKNVCPNCGGGFERRPTRPKDLLKQYPPRRDKIFKPVENNPFLNNNVNKSPRER